LKYFDGFFSPFHRRFPGIRRKPSGHDAANNLFF
jgi:hypothetical protein